MAQQISEEEKMRLENKRFLILSEFAKYLGKNPGNTSRLKVWMQTAQDYPIFTMIDGNYFQIGTHKMIDLEKVEITTEKKTVIQSKK